MFVLNLFYEKEKNPKLTRFITEKLQESGIPIKRPRNHLLVTDHPIILAGLEATDVTEGMFLEHAKAMFNTQNNINAYLTSSNTGEMPLLTISLAMRGELSRNLDGARLRQVLNDLL